MRLPARRKKGGWMSARANDKMEGVQGGKMRALGDDQPSDAEKDDGGKKLK